jgi:transcriptional regulator with XRE-family HTH domain
MKTEELISENIRKVLEQTPTLQQTITHKKMMLALKIIERMKQLNWRKLDLLHSVEKNNPSIVTKWLSGTHNFTIETLFEIEAVLGITIIDLCSTDLPNFYPKSFVTTQENLEVKSPIPLPN